MSFPFSPKWFTANPSLFCVYELDMCAGVVLVLLMEYVHPCCQHANVCLARCMPYHAATSVLYPFLTPASSTCSVYFPNALKMSRCDTFAVCSRLLSLNHSPSHPFILCPYPQSALPLPSLPLPHYCPTRSASRPALTNHNTSKPGGGVKKVTGVGGTTYEISV